MIILQTNITFNSQNALKQSHTFVKQDTDYFLLKFLVYGIFYIDIRYIKEEYI